MIRVSGLTKVFSAGGEVVALHDIRLDVDKGDIYGIIGMSGAGKSTLLRCIGLLETPTQGSVVGIIFLGYNLLMQRTVADNVSFPLELSRTDKATRKARVAELLELVGLSDKANSYPSQLSGGQKQRVAIARALANNPRILLCDEPTSALDSFTTKSILALLKQINQRLGVTIVIITHEIGVVRAICNKVAIINEGSFVEQGETDKVLVSPEHPVTKLLLGMDEEGK